ncbi:hypothetical protein J7E49_06910 [Variovorax paradoxus]|nr:hypothetical protein [Variovorax paradoxus]
MTALQNIVANSGTITQLNENFDAVSAAGIYGRRAPAVVGLTWAYYGGRGFGNTVADGTLALTASTTNYVVASRSTGAVSVATSTTNWNDTTNYYRLRLITTGAAAITLETDYREFAGGGSVGGFTGGTLSSALNEAPPATLASASTVNIGAAAANTVNVTGTTTIAAFDTIAAGAVRRVIFAGALTLTHNATSLILPTAANITTAAGDVAEFVSLGSSNWKCIGFTRASGAALVGSGSFTGGTLTSALNEAPPVTIASASTMNIGAAAANSISVTGTTTVTAFDTFAAGAKRELVFAAALTLTHNATSLILPTGANITTAAGDVADFVSLGSGNWRCVNYVRANGQALAAPGGGFTGGTLTSALNEAPQVTLASASTVNIGAAAANTVTVSGTTTITAFDTIATGAIRRVRFLAVLTLTHNATNLILPGSANITTAAGDVATMESLGAGNWRCIDYAKSDGTAVVGGGGLTGFTSALNTASPNATVNVSSLTASGGTANQDTAIIAKGTGAVLSQIPDNSTAGGNRRGANAVDFQMVRVANTQVANGVNATIAGGQSNTASGTGSFAVGQTNTASGTGSIAIGSSSTATLQNSIAMGSSSTASAAHAIAMGAGNTADGNYSMARGTNGTTRGVTSADVFGVHNGGALGRYQRSTYVGFAQTADATQKVLTADGAAAGAANQVFLAASTAHAIKILVVARKQGASADSKMWEITLGAYRDTTAASTAVIGTATVTVIGASAGASGWLCDAVADTANGAISVRGTGQAATNIRWLFSAQTVEVEYP